MLIEFAEHELKAAGLYDADAAYGGLIPDAVMELIRAFAAQGHSGNSARIVAGLFHKLAGYKALGPLTGADDEWVEVSGGPNMKWQNKRCFHVFKREDGTAWDGDAVIFREPNGNCYTSGDSRKDITFPYTPTPEYRDVPSEDSSRG